MVEGAGSYGAGAASYLTAAGELVTEFNHPYPTRDGAKTDALDARRAACRALGRSWRACIHVCVRWVLYCCGWCESRPERRCFYVFKIVFSGWLVWLFMQGVAGVAGVFWLVPFIGGGFSRSR